ncbi:hypothetical protein PVL30_005081 [Lodderomyces elongisporus]|uniref:uncharacterized protein n=1 Tax=Lodderomyces elongisporus TaxID=36914 RepID=UPI002920A79C|nr:uncharacterized protein PVL30_005081 [Lodderomyces elongisporus]WLF81284.1 hypothetical protein PVL30_005081 [Lodderomyces elongisporus]
MVFTFVIDNYVNKYLPRNQLHKLPRPVSFFLGYHDPPHPRSPVPDYILWLEIAIGTFSGLALIMGVFMHHNVFTDHHHAPILLASYAASAILCFNTSQVPLAQPRNVFMGHFVAALIGTCIQKLFSLSEHARDNYWASAALSVAVSSVAMSILNCIHPPAGASAVLPSIDAQIRQMSWWYLPVQLISSVLILSVALITGNIVRSYPVYWWSPGKAGKKPSTPSSSTREERISRRGPTDEEKQIESSIESSTSDAEDGAGGTMNIDRATSGTMITITPDSIISPEFLDLDEVQIDWLKMLQSKLISSEEEQRRKKRRSISQNSRSISRRTSLRREDEEKGEDEVDHGSINHNEQTKGKATTSS